MINILEVIEAHPIIPVYYNDDIDACKKALKGCYNGGVRVFEFVNRGAFALQNFAELVTYRNEHFPDLMLGIGTIKTQQQALDFLNLKADFIVSPIVIKEIAEVTLDKGVFWIPGAMTPTEIALAESLGAQLVKLFPGDLLGTSFLQAIKPLFPTLKFMPTGGVVLEQDSIKKWYKAGVSAIGAGSALFKDVDDEALAKRLQQLFTWSKNG